MTTAREVELYELNIEIFTNIYERPGMVHKPLIIFNWGRVFGQWTNRNVYFLLYRIFITFFYSRFLLLLFFKYETNVKKH